MSALKIKKMKKLGIKANIKTDISKFLFLFLPSVLIILVSMLMLISCTSVFPDDSNMPEILVAESFLADITKNISGDRLSVDSLVPVGLDPHGFEPTPADIIKLNQCDILIINGAGFEEWLEKIIPDTMKKIIIVEASKGLQNRVKNRNLVENKKNSDEKNKKDARYTYDQDPHFWLDPNLVKTYVDNIRNALVNADPDGKGFYDKNAEEYIKRLEELDKWIMEEVNKIPENKRLLVTNHESFGYFADRYGLEVIGTIIPSSSTVSSPSARDIAELIDKIKSLDVKTIFLEKDSDPAIANQIANETGIYVFTGLYTHSLTDPGQEAPTYIDMIKYNTTKIVELLE